MVLKPEQRDVPEPRAKEILIQVAAAGVNRPDVMQRKGIYPPPPGASDLPGLEVAGDRASHSAPDAKRWQPATRSALSPMAAVTRNMSPWTKAMPLPLPAGFTFTEAAALPETYFTVWHNVFQRGGLKPGETLLVHGGSSGIGTAAIQIATALGIESDRHRGLGRKMRCLREARRGAGHQLPG